MFMRSESAIGSRALVGDGHAPCGSWTAVTARVALRAAALNRGSEGAVRPSRGMAAGTV
jgi:hypothetical protein